MKETLEMRGTLRIVGEDRDGNVVLDQVHRNRIVKTGRALVAKLFAGVPGTPPAIVSHMAVGTGGAASTDDDSSLAAERARKPISSVAFSDVLDAGVKRTQVRLQTVFDTMDANGTVPLREAGILNAGAAGTLYNRVTFGDVVKADTFKLTLIWDIVF